MKNIVFTSSLVLVLAMTMVACQTPPPAAELVWPATSSIATEVDGFSPKADAPGNTIELALTIGNPESVKAWSVDITSQNVNLKSFNGTGSSAPSTIAWDGMTNSGTMAPEGTYIAVLNVYYKSRYTTFTTESTPFILDVQPPSGKLVISPIEPVPSVKGFVVPVSITINAVSSSTSMESWSAYILDSNGKKVRGFSGKWPENSFTWDGLTSTGLLAPASSTYKISAKVRNVFGNTGLIEASLRVAALPVVVVPPIVPVVPGIPQTSSITPRTRGFSPNGDEAMDVMVFDLEFGQPQQVKTWKVDMMLNDKSIYVFSGSSTPQPASLTWDGKAANKRAAAEGSYYAMFTVEYGTAFKTSVVKSDAIILALSSPEGTVTLSESLYSPVESHPSIEISFKATSKSARMESWSMRIYDPARNLFRSFHGEWPTATVVWDGKGLSGEMVESAEDYPVVVNVQDEFGNSTNLTTIIPVDILVEKTATGYRILSSRIYFKAYTADYSSVDSVLAMQNRKRLDQLAEKLKKFQDYNIKIVGHAVMIFWNDPIKGPAEQKDILIPLSIARAEAMATAMIARGFDQTHLTIEGVGASDQLVPDSDIANRWRNRRVAFFLEKP